MSKEKIRHNQNPTYIGTQQNNFIMKRFLKTTLSTASSSIDLDQAFGSLDKKDYSIFVLTEKFKRLSLGDSAPRASGSSNSVHRYTETSSLFDRFKALSNTSTFTRSLMEHTKAPFIDIPKSITTLTERTNDYMMAFGFRFLPGQDEYLSQNLRIPACKEGLKSFRNQVGLTLSKDSLSSTALLKLKGLSDLSVDKTSMLSRVLVEAITYNNGYYGRFLILVKLGIGCTVWYGFTPGDGVNFPVEGLTPLFNHIDNYEAFIQTPEVHVQPGFNKITLVEGGETCIATVAEAFQKENPLTEIQIPAKGSTLMAVALGLGIVVLLAVGIAPNVDIVDI